MPCSRWLSAFSLVWVFACSARRDTAPLTLDAPAPPSQPPSQPPSPSTIVRLLDRLDPDDVEPGQEVVAPTAPLFRLERGAATASAPMQRIVAPLPAGLAARVRVRVRGVDAAALAAPITLQLQALRRLPVATSGDVRPADRIVAMPGIAQLPIARVSAPPTDGWRSLEHLEFPFTGRRGVELVLEAAGAFEFEALEVVEVLPARQLLELPRFPADDSPHEWRRIIRRGSESCDALILHPGGRARWKLAVPPRARLEARLAAAAPVDAALRSELRIDGELLFPAPTAAPGAERFTLWRFDLARYAGREVAFDWSLPAASPGSFLIGAPLLLAPGDESRPNLVIVSIDTLRADAVGCYGGDRRLTPAIDRLAAEGTLFARFIAASSWTLPSHATLFSGQEPSVHGAVRVDHRVMPQRTPLLAPTLAAAGWLTAGFTGGGFLDPAFGLSAGFDRYVSNDPGATPPPPRPATENPMGPVVRWLTDHRDLPFFLFVHTYVVHDYAPDDDVLASVAPAGSALRSRDATVTRERFGRGEVECAEDLKLLYRAALHQADQRVVARLLDTLATLDLADRTIVALVSDHGDEWLEHGGIYHGVELWQELVHVPWIVRGPGFPAGEVRDDIVGHLDVAPTLLARLGVAPPAAMRGGDVMAVDRVPEPVLSQVRAEDGSRIASVTAWPWRLLRRFASEDALTPEHHLFRHDLDPLEQDDLAAREPERVALLDRWLTARLAECEAAAAAAGTTAGAHAEIDAELRRQLEELGYAAGE